MSKVNSPLPFFSPLTPFFAQPRKVHLYTKRHVKEYPHPAHHTLYRTVSHTLVLPAAFPADAHLSEDLAHVRVLKASMLMPPCAALNFTFHAEQRLSLSSLLHGLKHLAAPASNMAKALKMAESDVGPLLALEKIVYSG